jgi:hypothetical protein
LPCTLLTVSPPPCVQPLHVGFVSCRTSLVLTGIQFIPLARVAAGPWSGSAERAAACGRQAHAAVAAKLGAGELLATRCDSEHPPPPPPPQHAVAAYLAAAALRSCALAAAATVALSATRVLRHTLLHLGAMEHLLFLLRALLGHRRGEKGGPVQGGLFGGGFGVIRGEVLVNTLAFCNTCGVATVYRRAAVDDSHAGVALLDEAIVAVTSAVGVLACDEGGRRRFYRRAGLSRCCPTEFKDPG